MELVMYRTTTLALMLSLGLAATVQAKAQKEAVRMDATMPVSEQIRRVETAMGSEDYSEIGLEDKSRVQQALNRIKVKMNGREKVDELAAQERTDIFNEQEIVNTIMSRAQADSRMVCRRERLTGSNMPQSVCMTVAQRRKAQEDSRQALTDQQRLSR
jgi:TolA-binding protein